MDRICKTRPKGSTCYILHWTKVAHYLRIWLVVLNNNRTLQLHSVLIGLLHPKKETISSDHLSVYCFILVYRVIYLYIQIQYSVIYCLICIWRHYIFENSYIWMFCSYVFAYLHLFILLFISACSICILWGEIYF